MQRYVIGFLYFLLIKAVTRHVHCFGANFVVSAEKDLTVEIRLHLEYYRIGTSQELGLRKPNNVFQCMTSCTKLAECRSFYQDKGSCVFGLTQLVSGIQAENLTPINDNQKIFAKGKIQTIN